MVREEKPGLEKKRKYTTQKEKVYQRRKSPK